MRKAQECSTAKGYSKLEFLSVWSEVHSALQKGYNAKFIWKALSESGMIHCGYTWFARMVRQQLTKDELTPETSELQQTEQEIT